VSTVQKGGREALQMGGSPPGQHISQVLSCEMATALEKVRADVVHTCVRVS